MVLHVLLSQSSAYQWSPFHAWWRQELMPPVCSGKALPAVQEVGSNKKGRNTGQLSCGILNVGSTDTFLSVYPVQ